MTRPTHTVFCDGGLSNRLNTLLMALVLRRRYGHDWQISWPRNNWCGAAFDALFACDLPVHEHSLDDCLAASGDALLLAHDIPQLATLPPARVARHAELSGYGDYARRLAGPAPVFYVHHLIPSFVSVDDIGQALRELRLAPEVQRRAAEFCTARQIDRSVLGLHIRKTDFGAAVDDDALYRMAAGNPRRFFVCSDDRGVNERFAALPNCAVFPKHSFPEKRQQDGDWLSWTTDSEGKPTPFNIDRPQDATIEGLIDLLILSRTELIKTSNSTFLNMAGLFGATGYFTPASPTPMNPQPPNQGDILNLINLIRPWHMASDHKVRVGSDGDGGYVLPSAAKRSTLVLSIGIGNEISFDQELAGLGARIYQYDHTIPGAPYVHPNIQFHKLGWGPQDAGELLSLRGMMARADWSGARHPLLKFDTEGAEWDSLLATDSADLARFEIITGEFHDFHQLTERAYFDRVHAVFSKLAQTHHVVHLHANNAGGLFVLGGIPFPRLLELTYLRKDAAVFGGHSTEPIPGPLDRPNVPQLPDLYLRTF